MNPSSTLASVVLDELVRCGVGHVVLAPGSRSAPLAIAAARAEAQGRLRLHVRIDERSAGFLALGLARGSRAPVAVICTSGSAVANLLPAVLEAAHAGVPLVLLTADRPPQLRGIGANQTTRQPGIFGCFVREAIDLATPADEPGQVRYWRSVIASAILRATEPADSGPVHVNLSLREPLVPEPALAQTEPRREWSESLGGRPGGRAWLRRVAPDQESPPALARVLDQAGLSSVPARGLVLAGDLADPGAAAAAGDLARSLGWPLIAEPTANAARAQTLIEYGALVLGAAREVVNLMPEVVLTVGRVGLSRAATAQVLDAPAHIAVDPGPLSQPFDATRSASVRVRQVPWAEPGAALDTAWLDSWRAASDQAAQVLRSALADTPEDGLCGPVIARTLWSRIPGDAALFAAASWPVRQLHAFASRRPDPPEVFGNRGVSGIDGLVSTAWGVACARTAADGTRTYALLGDLAYLHDHNGLIATPGERAPELTIVVADNDGGGIFSSLEPAQPHLADVFERVFGTPHGLDLAGMAQAAGIRSRTVDKVAELGAAIAEADHRPGVSVVIARTISRKAEAALLARISSELQDRLAGDLR